MPEDRIQVPDIAFHGRASDPRNWCKFGFELHPIKVVRKYGGQCICRLREEFGGEVVGDRLCRANKGAVNFNPYFILKNALKVFVSLF